VSGFSTFNSFSPLHKDVIPKISIHRYAEFSTFIHKGIARRAQTVEHLTMRNTFLMRLRPVLLNAAACLPLALLGGCQVTPSVAVLGAFFPDWMFCMMFAVVIAVLIDGMLKATGWRRHFEHWSLITGYAALCISVALLSWLVVF
jgi:hypothetical protein